MPLTDRTIPTDSDRVACLVRHVNGELMPDLLDHHDTALRLLSSASLSDRDRVVLEALLTGIITARLAISSAQAAAVIEARFAPGSST